MATVPVDGDGVPAAAAAAAAAFGLRRSFTFSSSAFITALDGSSSRPFSYEACAWIQFLRPKYAAPRREWPFGQSPFSSMHLFASSSASVNEPLAAYAPLRLE